MAEIVVIGAGLSGTIMAYELLPQLRREDQLALVGQGSMFHFVPSNPWVAVGWSDRPDIEVELSRVMARKRPSSRGFEGGWRLSTSYADISAQLDKTP